MRIYIYQPKFHSRIYIYIYVHIREIYLHSFVIQQFTFSRNILARLYVQLDLWWSRRWPIPDRDLAIYIYNRYIALRIFLPNGSAPIYINFAEASKKTRVYQNANYPPPATPKIVFPTSRCKLLVQFSADGRALV